MNIGTTHSHYPEWSCQFCYLWQHDSHQLEIGTTMWSNLLFLMFRFDLKVLACAKLWTIGLRCKTFRMQHFLFIFLHSRLIYNPIQVLQIEQHQIWTPIDTLIVSTAYVLILGSCSEDFSTTVITSCGNEILNLLAFISWQNMRYKFNKNQKRHRKLKHARKAVFNTHHQHLKKGCKGLNWSAYYITVKIGYCIRLARDRPRGIKL